MDYKKLNEIWCLLKNACQPFTPKCKVKRTFNFGYDNGITPDSSSNDGGKRPNFIKFDWAFTEISWEVNGQIVTDNSGFGPFVDWGDQLQGWAAWFNANDPNAPTSVWDFGFDPAPTWRFAEVTGCNPRAVYGKVKLVRDDGCIFYLYPILPEVEETRLLSFARMFTATKLKEIVWCALTGEETTAPENPECFVSCDYTFDPFIAEDAKSPCKTDLITVCDSANDDQRLIMERTTCDGGNTYTKIYYTEASYLIAQSADDLVEVTPSSEDLVLCDSGLPVVDPEPVVDCDLLSTYATECVPEGGGNLPEADYTGAIQITTGRPLNTALWELIDNRDPNNQVVVISGTTFQDFVANAALLGYTDFTSGPTLEQHYLCPCPPNLVNAGDYFVQADGNTVTKPVCTPLSELPNAPNKVLQEALKALRVKVCGTVDVNIPDELIGECFTTTGGGEGVGGLLGSRPSNVQVVLDAINGNAGPHVWTDFTDPAVTLVCGDSLQDTAVDLGLSGTNSTVTVAYDSIQNTAAGWGITLVDTATGLLLPITNAGTLNVIGGLMADTSTAPIGTYQITFDTSSVADLSTLLFVAIGGGENNGGPDDCDEFGYTVLDPPVVVGEPLASLRTTPCINTRSEILCDQTGDAEIFFQFIYDSGGKIVGSVLAGTDVPYTPVDPEACFNRQVHRGYVDVCIKKADGTFINATALYSGGGTFTKFLDPSTQQDYVLGRGDTVSAGHCKVVCKEVCLHVGEGEFACTVNAQRQMTDSFPPCVIGDFDSTGCVVSGELLEECECDNVEFIAKGKVLGTLPNNAGPIIQGDLGLQAGDTIDLTDANGNVTGTATVGSATYDATTGQSAITLQSAQSMTGIKSIRKV